ncbi:hypothetical protein [Pelosinus sp. sgz500959]|uniref:hypothetical protein n=1 Tax=Pelosinus sp. sgz500959 TaxID=3242472 RepID=UPI003671B251
MKKVIAFTLMLLMLGSTVCLAAVSSSGAKPSSSSSSKPSTSTPSLNKQTAPANNAGEYKPSAPANSYGDKAPEKQVAPSVQQGTQSPSSTNSFWRNASMFGGGMLAGSLLGNLFGSSHMGGGSSIFGMLMNLIMIGGVVLGIRYLWNKSRNKDR